MNDFWDKVKRCDHEFSPTYYERLYCLCNGHEVRCLKCGVYISKCSCGMWTGMSGWSIRRIRAEQQRISRRVEEKFRQKRRQGAEMGASEAL